MVYLDISGHLGCFQFWGNSDFNIGVQVFVLNSALILKNTSQKVKKRDINNNHKTTRGLFCDNFRVFKIHPFSHAYS